MGIIQSIPIEHRAEVSEFAAVMGFALSNWAHLEDSLCDIYLYCFGFEDTQTSAIAFRKTKGVNTRLSAINEALDLIGIGKLAMAEWSNIYNRVTAKGRIRDKLAHSQIFHYQRRDGTWNVVALPFTGIRTSFLATSMITGDLDTILKERFTGDNTPLTKAQIEDLAADCTTLVGRCEEFARREGGEIMRLRSILARKRDPALLLSDPNGPKRKRRSK